MSMERGIMGLPLITCLVLLIKTVTAGQCKTTSAVLGYSLRGHVIRRVPAKEHAWCTFACERESCYRSVNFVPARKTCELNNATRHLVPWSFVPRKHAAYSDMLYECETGWMEFQTSCYLFSTEKLNWHGARAKCESLGATLVIIKSAENSFIARQLIGKETWIGMTDEKQEGRWVWVDGSEVVYENFDHGEPNNDEGKEHYGAIWEFGQWNDELLSFHLHYICQKP